MIEIFECDLFLLIIFGISDRFGVLFALICIQSMSRVTE